MSLKARTYVAMLLSLALLAGAVVAPACAHGTACPYMTQRGWVASAMPMPVASDVVHNSHCAFATPHSGAAPTRVASSAPSNPTGRAKDCCAKDSGAHMRLADDRANFTEVPSMGLAVAQAAVVPQQVSALLPPLPSAMAPPQRALSSTVIRI